MARAGRLGVLAILVVLGGCGSAPAASVADPTTTISTMAAETLTPTPVPSPTSVATRTDWPGPSGYPLVPTIAPSLSPRLGYWTIENLMSSTPVRTAQEARAAIDTAFATDPAAAAKNPKVAADARAGIAGCFSAVQPETEGAYQCFKGIGSLYKLYRLSGSGVYYDAARVLYAYASDTTRTGGLPTMVRPWLSSCFHDYPATPDPNRWGYGPCF